MEQPAIQHGVKATIQALQVQRVSGSELNFDPALSGLLSGESQRYAEDIDLLGTRDY